MSGFTTATITHVFENADGTWASGSLTFQLSKRMTQPGLTLVPAEVTANLDGTGHLSIVLTANNDPGTIPADAQWMMTMRILGASEETFGITVPTGGGSVDLATLLPQGEG